jgi:hypothetical protein
MKKQKVEYKVKPYKGWYYVEKVIGKEKKYYNNGKWYSNILKGESYETYQLANEVRNTLI